MAFCTAKHHAQAGLRTNSSRFCDNENTCLRESVHLPCLLYAWHFDGVIQTAIVNQRITQSQHLQGLFLLKTDRITAMLLLLQVQLLTVTIMTASVRPKS